MPAAAMRTIRCSLGLALLTLVGVRWARGDDAAKKLAPPVELTAKEDHQRLMGILKITSLRKGADGRNPKAENAANYDESKANPYPKLPDPLVLKNGQEVTTAEMWMTMRRPEIIADFDTEIYGRLPKEIPKVSAECRRSSAGTTSYQRGRRVFS